MSSPKDPSAARIATDELKGRIPGWPDRQANEWARANEPLGNVAAEAEQRWNHLAQQGKWMIAVYQCSQSTISDVVRLKRAHLNDLDKVRIETELVRVVRERETDVLLMEGRPVLDVPAERILWYEIIDEIGPKDVPLYRAAVERGVQARRELENGEPQAASEARMRPR